MLTKRFKREYGILGSSIRYCIRCKMNTTFMPIGYRHSQCLMCHGTHARRAV